MIDERTKQLLLIIYDGGMSETVMRPNESTHILCCKRDWNFEMTMQLYDDTDCEQYELPYDMIDKCDDDEKGEFDELLDAIMKNGVGAT